MKLGKKIVLNIILIIVFILLASAAVTCENTDSRTPTYTEVKK